MITEDQVVALFAKANPVPSLDLLDPVEPLDPVHLEDRSERSREMTELKTTERQEVGRRRRWLIPAIATIAIAVVAIPIVMNTLRFTAHDMTPSEEVATAFMAAVAEHDGNAVAELFAPGGLIDGTSPSNLGPAFDHDRAIRWDYINQGCEETSTGPDGTLVTCPYILENDWIRVLELEPGTGTIVILVDGGQILTTSNRLGRLDGVSEAWNTFRAWVQENHPDDIPVMYTVGGGDANTTPDSIALWEQYTEEFVAERGG